MKLTAIPTERNGRGKNYTVDKTFIDTNVLVYTIDDGNPGKQKKAKERASFKTPK
jgi:hypothetical protein